MKEGRRGKLLDYFEDLEDPRIDRCKRHSLSDIITIAICAAICGAGTWVHVAMFGRSKEGWLRTFLELPNGIPSHDTFGDVFSRLDPERFQECFMEWSQGVADLLPGEVAAIDGKTGRRSYDTQAGKRALHLVSAWASANTLTLGQVSTGEKSNEITAIPRLLELKGCIVTIDAMGCQKEIAQGILDREAGYVLAVKQNQRRLYEDLKDLFEEAEATGFAGSALRLCHHPEQEPRPPGKERMLSHRRPGVPGLSEHRSSVAWIAPGGEGGGAQGSSDGRYGATPLLHQQPGSHGRATAGRGTVSLEH